MVSSRTRALVVPAPLLRIAVCPAVPYDSDRRFRGVVDV
jgi:hypothetical protein